MFSEYHKIEMSLNYVLNYIFQNISNAILSCWSGIIMILSDREYYERLKLLLERVVKNYSVITYNRITWLFLHF